MGLFNKLKNVLFEETEIEEPEIEEVNEQKLDEKIEKATMNLPKIDRRKKEEKKITNEYNYDDEPDSELFKIEKTFDFPAFDEDEFDDFIPRKKEVEKSKKIDEKEEERREKELRRSRIEQPKKTKSEYSSTRIIRTTREEPMKKNFHPSPVISPVYGILDKNYKKEDVLTRDEKLERESVKLDVDSVRKKAFGALEEDLVHSSDKEEPIIKFYEDIDDVVSSDALDEIEDNIEDTLLGSANIEEIDVTKEMELPTENIEETLKDNDGDTEDLKDIEDAVDEIEEELEIDENEDTYEDDEQDEIDELFEETEDKIEIEEEVKTKRRKRKEQTAEEIIDEKIEEELSEEDTKDEDDLFELIDSMYENKEDE
ncbi:MAG: hypothetical protein E7158_06180 [Firmicutes bacterium]|nr:hypothetical protein [Bacillota bacterium]